MKTFLLLLIILTLEMCSPSERTIQAEMSIVILVDMEPYFRNNQEWGCKLVWEDKNHIRYSTLSQKNDFCDNFIIGARYTILLHK